MMNHTTRPLSQMQSHTKRRQHRMTWSSNYKAALSYAISLLVHIAIPLGASDILMMSCHMLQHCRGEDSDANGVWGHCNMQLRWRQACYMICCIQVACTDMCLVLCRAQKPCHSGRLLRRWAVGSFSIWRWLLLRVGLGRGHPEA